MINHKDYIDSPEWARKKEEYYSKHPRKCQICNTEKRIHLHHKTYERLGKEEDNDLVPLCAAHHERLHEEHNAYGGYLENYTDRFIKSFTNGDRLRKSYRDERDRAIACRNEAITNKEQLLKELGKATDGKKRSKLKKRLKRLDRKINPPKSKTYYKNRKKPKNMRRRKYQKKTSYPKRGKVIRIVV